ncbi:MAG: FAD-dependent oxidoreductase [Eubacteriales bacterium]|nr:FAD-dependent oxidoreductase [Eubacteriales bacterium]
MEQNLGKSNIEEMDFSRFYDVVVIGGGPAGLTAGIYLARARYRVLIIEKENFGGQITITAEVVNYPGVARTSGSELTETMRRQAQSFGAEFLSAEVTGLSVEGDVKTVHTGRGDYSCFGILLATGAHPRMIGFQGEKEFRGRGVAYCATCDGEFFTGKEVFVVGGGFAAAEESVFLTKYARHVTILMITDDFTCAKATADAARTNEKITVITNVAVEAVEGESTLRSLRYKNLKTGEVTEYHSPDNERFGVFVFAGYEPATDLIRGIAELDGQGYVVTDSNRKTNVEGLYAAGDVCVKNLRQVVTAVGDGAQAATELEKYAHAMQEKTGLRPKMETSNAHGLAGDAAEARAAGTPAQDSLDAGTGAGSSAGANADSAAGSGGAAPGAGSASGEGATAGQSALFTPEMIAQLHTVFDRMAQPLVLQLYLDERPVSQELEGYMTELTKLTDKLSLQKASAEETAALGEDALPCVRVCRNTQESGLLWTGLAFHGVPGGHEFTSFVLGLYNAAGPGQALDAQTTADIQAIAQPVNMTIIVSLSCTMCPELVASAQRIAALNPQVTAEVYDVNHFPALRDRYQVMSVPCLVIGEDEVTFGKKNVRQLLDLIAK